MSRIFVSGIGIVSAIGTTQRENRTALLSGISGLRHAQFIDTRHAQRFVFGEVKQSSDELKQELKAFEKGITRTSLLALKAFNEAVQDSGWDPKLVSAHDTAFINASTVGGMSETDHMYRDANSTSNGSEYTGSYDFASSAVYLQERYGLRGPVNTINTACSSSANAILFGARLIQHGLVKRAIVGGTDSLSKFTINGFHALGILSPEPCRPFDENRKGLNLGEGAAYLVLEREEDCTQKKVYAELRGYANTNDSFHPSSLSDTGEGPYLAMKTALERAMLTIQDIHYINAHGTGTGNNDLVESKAMLRLFPQVPPFQSTKSYSGHTLGAAGAIEAVFTILSLLHGERYSSLHFSNPISETGLRPIEQSGQIKIVHALSNSFGFGGNCSTLVFSKA